MADTLPTGTRRFPVAQMVEAKADDTLLKPADAPAMSGETVNVNIGTLPAGETVTLTFDVTVDCPLPAGVTQVCNQGTVSGNLGATPFTEVTDDPVTGAADDPTCTLVLAAPIMSASKTAVDVNGGNTIPGDVIEYTISIGNTGNQDAGGTTLTDRLPANTTYVAGSTTLNGALSETREIRRCGDDDDSTRLRPALSAAWLPPPHRTHAAGWASGQSQAD